MEKDKEKIEEEINENHESQDLDDFKDDNIDETNLENYACRDEIAVIINLGI